ncbi:MBOAT family O-acyltransferase [Chthonobacter albigriseus]|uniref:MBOAT family O-acyltransferase n=1 Tax=Chthonobacter albigriseus TaxID=1683161 RepID=UPI0015EF2AFD|nr:MBOAT family protein [Chthonobacter albigriseus]
MIFSSNIFVFVFLPLFLAVYYLTPMRWRSMTIVIGSWTFYGWWRVDFLALYALVTVWSYVMGHLIASARDQESAKLRCIVGSVGSLMVLFYFKYWNFFTASLIDVLGVTSPAGIFTMQIILPIGISFFIFESISYMMDIYRKDAPPARNFVDFAAFLALYPHLIAGPVMRYKDLSAQIVSRTHTWTKFNEGCVWFMIGFAKKVLIADSVAPLADLLFSAESPTFTEAWLGATAYTVQLYFDFSGYSEMAIGLGLMIGFRLIKNFDSPYISRSITEFWRRWHISLSEWLRDYLYITLGGNRKGRARTYVNLFLTMLLGGLWHGANWTFIVWGAWHGGILALERALGGKGKESPYPKLLAWPITIVAVMLGWVMFRAHDVGSAFAFYEAMVGLNGFALTDEYAWRITDMQLAWLLIAIAVVFIEPNMRRITRGVLAMGRSAMTVGMGRAALVTAFAFAVLKMSADSYSPFLYFQF